MRIALLALSLTLFGCASTPAPPAPEGEWRSVHVVNHGLHTGLVIVRADLLDVLPGLTEAFDDGDFLELGWGDEDFYRAAQPTLGLTLQALFWPSASALHVLTVAGDPRRQFAGRELIEVRLAEHGYRQLLGFVAARVTRTAQGALLVLGPGQYAGSRFYRAEGRYSLLYTCNTWVGGGRGRPGVAPHTPPGGSAGPGHGPPPP
ncbi:DUF2459 domain-containing protein, partial [Pseudomonas sp.]|uniref:DUF2459 domain-containing protein n=1 Tax=Pseudomonas sp. TaxID=306 RepID=UPI00299E34EC